MADPIPELVEYLKAIKKSVLRPYSVHVATVEGSTDVARAEGRTVKWAALVRAVGRPEAERLVSEWVARPYKLE